MNKYYKILPVLLLSACSENNISGPFNVKDYQTTFSQCIENSKQIDTHIKRCINTSLRVSKSYQTQIFVHPQSKITYCFLEDESRWSVCPGYEIE